MCAAIRLVVAFGIAVAIVAIVLIRTVVARLAVGDSLVLVTRPLAPTPATTTTAAFRIVRPVPVFLRTALVFDHGLLFGDPVELVGRAACRFLIRRVVERIADGEGVRLTGIDRDLRLRRFGTMRDGDRLVAGAVVGFQDDAQAVMVLEFLDPLALLVEDVERRRGRNLDDEIVVGVLLQMLLDRAQHMQRRRRGRADMAGALADRASLHGGFQHAGADPLTAHFQQAEMRDAADLDAGPVALQALLDFLLDGAVVALLVHVDEVDDDQAGEVAQTQLARHLFGGFHVGLVGRVLDRVFLGGTPRIDVDGDQRLGLVDDDVAARLQRDVGLHHLVELRFDALPHEDRGRVTIGLHDLRLARHEHPHEVLGFAVARLAGDENLVDVLVVEVADRSLDQAAFLVDEGRGDRGQRDGAHRLPQPHQIFVVALDLRLGAVGTGRAQDDAHAARHVELAHDILQPLAVGRIGDLARDAAATRRVRHQHRIATGQRQIGGQGRALVAALFLDDLHQQDLPTLDDFLDLVLATLACLADRHFLHGVLGADLVDLVVAVLVTIALVVAGRAGAPAPTTAAAPAPRRPLGPVLLVVTVAAGRRDTVGIGLRVVIVVGLGGADFGLVAMGLALIVAARRRV